MNERILFMKELRQRTLMKDNKMNEPSLSVELIEDE